MGNVRIGVIGGSGLYQIEGLAEIEEIDVSTPFGSPSDTITVGTLSGQRVAFLPRHGRGHRISPSELPMRANIYALKSLGVERIISVSAVGSLREELRPLDVVIPDQLLDRTKGIRPPTFFGEGLVVHIAFAEPYCPELSRVLYEAAQAIAPRVHSGGTLVVMEGPQFSTKAESFFYRRLDADLIGMTALPEAKLAREAEICYATIALVTDYDCWHEAEESVTVDLVIQNLLRNVDTAKKTIAAALPAAAAEWQCPCQSALQNAIITQPDLVPEATKQSLELLVGKYL
jgi:5'-methylthioadenosine phosphorylase